MGSSSPDRAGSPAQALSRAGSPVGSLSRAGSPANSVLSRAGSPTNSVLSRAGSVARSVSRAGSVARSVSRAGSVARSVSRAGSVAKSVSRAGSVARSVSRAGSVAKSQSRAGSLSPRGSKAGSDTEGDKLNSSKIGSDDELENLNSSKVGSEDEADKESESEEEVSTEVETEIEEEVYDDDEPQPEATKDSFKKAVRRTEYDLLKHMKLGNLIDQFGLKPSEFGINVRDNYQRIEVKQSQEEIYKEAEKYLNEKTLKTESLVLESAVRMVGWQLAHEPQVRKTIRENFFVRAKINVKPTPKGMKIIDEQHMLFNMKYLKEKPVNDLLNEQYLKLQSGVDDKLISMEILDTIEGHQSISYLDELKQLYYKDEFSSVVQEWNDLRGRAVEFAYNKIVVDLKRELHERLLAEANNYVLEKCCTKLHDDIKVAPYRNGDFADEDEDEWDTSKGFRVLAFSYERDRDLASYGVLLKANGEVEQYKKFSHLTARKNHPDPNMYAKITAGKEDDMERFRDMVTYYKPHVVCVGGESRDAMYLVQDLKDVLVTLEEQEQFPKINVEIIDNSFSKIYACSKKGLAEYVGYPPLLVEAISLARRVQDPLLEFSQLCNEDDEILNVRYHPLQDLLAPPLLLSGLHQEFVNRTNEVGVDLNLAVANPYRQNLVQFLGGLGPRKAADIIKKIKQSNTRLENRNNLVITYHMGPKVYVNVAGFVKIDTTAFGDSDAYIEALDSTRIHPEAYDWARKMAVDALDCDEDDVNKPSEALEEILEYPEKLNELDLEAFANELQNQGFGLKNTTLDDIRHELKDRYRDYRIPFESPRPEELFNMLTKETPETLYAGKLVQCRVGRIFYRKPRGEQLDNANPVRNDESGLWKCPFCMKNDFPELSDVWSHFDKGECPGQAFGINVRIDDNINGFIQMKNLSDKQVTKPEERVKIGGVVHARIIKIDPEKFSVDLTSRTSDLQDQSQSLRQNKDSFYDFDAEEADLQQTRKKMAKNKKQYHKRVISHPSFHNVDYTEVGKILGTMDQGEAIIRPSSKGIDHLTVSWKVTENIYQHIDVIEQDKQNHFSLGKKLWIGNQEFEDLDEILARYISPLAANARQILEYKYYKESVMGDKNKAAEILKKEKEKNAKAIPYIFSPLKDCAGRFQLSYLPRVKVAHECVSVEYDGFKFRKRHTFVSLAALIKWFKTNFRNIQNLGGATPGRMSSRTPYMGGHTPGGMDTPGSVHHRSGSSHHGGMTPYSTSTPSTHPTGTPMSNYPGGQTPYTPTAQTPSMTPYPMTPGPYGGVTPNPNLPTQMPPPAPAAHHGYNNGGRTPLHGARTPQLGSRTPQHHGSRTPQHHGSRTPQHHSARTPQHGGRTPQHGSHHGNRTPNHGGRTPQHGSSRTPQYGATPQQRHHGSHHGSNHHGSQHGNHGSQHGNHGQYTPGSRTPRGADGHYGRTPTHNRPVNRYQPYPAPPGSHSGRSTPRSHSGRSTPGTDNSPSNMSIAGDQTPLIDE